MNFSEILSNHVYTLNHRVDVQALLLGAAVLFASFAFKRFVSGLFTSNSDTDDDIGAEKRVRAFCYQAISWLIFVAGFVYALDCFGIETKALLTFLNYPLFQVADSIVNPLSFFVSIMILVMTFGAFRYVPNILRRRLFNQFSLSPGIEYTLQRIGQYLVIVIGILFALSYVGVKMEGLAVVAGLMSVGLGFGLQNIVSNFVSGIILLFERPVQVGDRIQVGNTEGDIQSIKIRCTVVNTPDNISYLVPNSELLSTMVINMSTNDPKIRLHVPVGVAYGSDVAKVKKCLLQVADEHPLVLKSPVPIVRFTNFGNSSLDFDLLPWIQDPARHPDISSDLRFAIDAIFRQNSITIPFPQRDVHMIPLKPADDEDA